MPSCFNFTSFIISGVEHYLHIIMVVFQGIRSMLDTCFRNRNIGVSPVFH